MSSHRIFPDHPCSELPPDVATNNIANEHIRDNTPEQFIDETGEAPMDDDANDDINPIQSSGTLDQRQSTVFVLDDSDEDFQEKRKTKTTTFTERSGGSVFDLLEVDKARPLPTWKKKLIAITDGTVATIYMTLLTILVLFIDDVRIAILPPEADDTVLVITYISLISFSIELMLNSAAKPKYFLGFYFWLDLVSTLSLLGDIPEFVELVTGESQNEPGSVGDSTTLARAGRTSRAGTRAGRIARVIRLVRLIRLMKLYRQYESNKDKASDVGDNTDEQVDLAESRVGQRLSDLTTRRVIIGVLGMLFILPLFEIEGGYYGQLTALDTAGVEILHDVAYATGPNSEAVEKSVDVFVHSVHYTLGSEYASKIIELEVWNSTKISDNGSGNLRGSEISTVEITTDECDAMDWDNCYRSKAVYEVKWAAQLHAILNIIKTFFVILVLGLGAMFFSKDANRLVLRPLERMIKTVREIAENPLGRQVISKDLADKNEEVEMETRILESSLKKVCSLLAVGFGDAGAQIIAENMKKAGGINPMVPGRKMIAIFGFCDIRQFTDTTEVLQEEIMEFVNAIAQIVHSEVAYHGGAANKNIGDAFLVVWKLPKNTRLRDIRNQSIDESSCKDFRVYSTIHNQISTNSDVSSDIISSYGSLPLNSSAELLGNINTGVVERWETIQKTADSALASFIIIQAAIKRSQHIKHYSRRDDLNMRIPDFAVRMGFGLHIGWAIEGAIGSEHKIDASYLSPNVNMASRLEAATKQFRTNILLSSDFVRCLSPRVRMKVRQIDYVTVKGSKRPMGLYTYDTTLEEIPDPVLPDNPDDFKSISFSNREYSDEWLQHPDLASTWAVNEEFLDKFAIGFNHYRQGNWTQAKTILEECRWARSQMNLKRIEDGPSVTLLEYMEQLNYTAPRDWPGFRELSEK
eukprot:g1836.t1